MTILITGADGFVGAALIRRLQQTPDTDVRACTRRPVRSDAANITWLQTPSLADDVSWLPQLADVDVVIHLAALVHRGDIDSPAIEQEYQAINVAGTRRLAAQAATAGVRRFIFLSSVKVHGDSGGFSETSPLAPTDAYGRSKRDAELALRQLGDSSGLEYVIVRPPLVYGPGVKANFRAIANAVAKGIPLPVGGIDNRRSLIAVDNLVDFLLLCTTHPAAAGEAFLVSDGEDLSTPQLVRMLGAAQARPGRVLRVPVSVLRLGARLIGRATALSRLTGTLRVDISKARKRLDWTPPIGVTEGLKRSFQP